MLSTLAKSRLKQGIKAALTVLVLAFVARHVRWTWNDLQSKGQSLPINGAWVAVAVGLYLIGLVAFGTYFWRVLRAGATSTAYYPALRAYLISHLGKYVPGKALVVVMRAGLVAAASALSVSA